MRVKILDFENGYVKNYQNQVIDEVDNKKVFELSNDEHLHFSRNSKFYKVKTKKLFFDENYKTKIDLENEKIKRAANILNLKLQLCGFEEQKEKFIKYSIGTKELDNKILEIQEKIKEMEGQNEV